MDARQEAALILLEMWEIEKAFPDGTQLHRALEAGRSRTRRARTQDVSLPRPVERPEEREPARIAMLRDFKRAIERATYNWPASHRRFFTDVAVGDASFLVAARRHIPTIVDRHQARRLWIRLRQELRHVLEE